jgi:hypothetical protein
MFCFRFCDILIDPKTDYLYNVQMSEYAASVDKLSPEQLDALGEEIATFAAKIDVAQHALLTRLRVFDAYEAWAQAGAV